MFERDLSFELFEILINFIIKINIMSVIDLGCSQLICE